MSESKPTESDTHSTEDSRVQKALGHLKSILVPSETLEAWTIQRRLFALKHRRTLLAATNGRLIALKRGLLGGFEPIDIRWQDLKDAKIRVGIFGAKISIVVYNTSDLSLSSSGGRLMMYTGLRKREAQDIYRLCQTHEQAWREKRRVREIEELRAKSGGMHFAGGASSLQPVDTGSAGTDSVKRLQQAKQMLDAKMISDTEYEAIKAKIINTV